MSAVDLSLSGLASGFDWKSVVAQLVQVERIPEQRLQADQAKLQQRNSAYGTIKDQISSLNTRLQTLSQPAFYDGRLAASGDSTVATASAGTGAAIGSYTINVTQLGTAAVQSGVTNVGTKLNSNNNVSALVLSNAAFATPITAGTITVNGKQVTIATTDTLQQVFNNISTATGGAVTGSYSNSTDKITLSSGSAIVLGSATDTSNFLGVAQLNNNGTGTVASAIALGTIKTSATLATANFSTAVSDGGAGAGEFKINGVSISYNASVDKVSDVLARINDSGAGVSATYDPTTDRFLLTNKTTGDIGFSLQDVTGNFLAAAKLSTGTLTRGKDLLYTVNGGSSLTSHSNIATEASSGITGLTFTALKVGATTVTVSADTAKVKTAINDFLTEYNKTQSLISSLTATTTDSSGKVTKSVLSGESDAGEITSSLRRAAFSTLSGLTGSIKSLADLGIDSNGNDDTLTLKDAAKLEDALGTKFNSVKDFFTHVKSGAEVHDGLAVILGSYADKTAGGTSLGTGTATLDTKQANLSKQAADITTQIANMERTVLANQARLTASFVAMETAQAKINQQLQYLTKRFG